MTAPPTEAPAYRLLVFLRDLIKAEIPGVRSCRIGVEANVTADNFAGPAAIALGPGATVTMDGIRPGLAIGIAGPGGEVVVDGKNGPTCKGPAFAGDFQTFKGCLS